jgi:1,4-alpha-glucan branching enzyme
MYGGKSMVTRIPAEKQGKVLVIFELPSAIWAESVSLEGDFNGEGRATYPLQQAPDDSGWRIEMELDAGCEYSFRYLVDGTNWCNDWHADRCVPNRFGGYDSVIIT